MSFEPITGTMLRDLVMCERRAWHDVHTDPRLRDEVGSFVRMLWEEGTRHEAAVLHLLQGEVVDLRAAPATTRRALTIEAMAGAADHVIGGEITVGDLVGRPDVLSRVDGWWVAGDAKSGSPFMPDGTRVREEYGVQIGLYALIIGSLGLGEGGHAFVIGRDGSTTMFDLDAPWGATTMASKVVGLVAKARAVVTGAIETRGEASARCGLCHWRSLCRGELDAADDLTLIPELGRSLRASIESIAPNRTALAELDLGSVTAKGGRTTLPGVGEARLARFRDRARLQLAPASGPYAREPLGLSRSPLEWHLDIEADPTRGGLVYLHGVWERRLVEGISTDRFLHFFADGEGADGERDAFAATWHLLNSDHDARIYYYSPFERTAYRALQRRHPMVCTADDIEAFFADPRVVDLYTDVVRPLTEWPLSSYGIKPIAKSCGFSWRAEDASGASSIAWYDAYVRTGDAELRDRIVDYNRSDCIASAVVLDALIALPVGPPIERRWSSAGEGVVAQPG